jgi:hypothetical protein|tara:strand:+ start:58 stop:330 length:273 start_codon:yes stop_codon:yes gene_type:complete
MSKEKKNSIEIAGQPTKVIAKRLTFFDIQKVAPILATDSIDFSNYWHYAFSNWLDCEPVVDILTLSPKDGGKLAALLPEPHEVAGWLVFQ